MKWFSDGKLNITENIFERNFNVKSNTAIIWEPNDISEKPIFLTYNQLFKKVCSFANVLKKLGVAKGDIVIIYLPMIPEAAISMLACARIGAVHSVVFAGFSASSLSDRINDCNAKIVITSDGNYRGDKIILVKNVVDSAVEKSDSITSVLVINRTSIDVIMAEGRDVWLHEIEKSVDDVCDAEPMSSEDMLFILYTSGSTGKPKGIVHTCGGYMIFAQYTFENVFQYKDGDIFWCTADVGWITGHSYIVYGPLLKGAKTVMFEGVPTYPDPSRFWKIIDKHKVNQFYTAPTAIRALQSYGDKYLEGASLNTLKVIGSVGEPINEEAWNWYFTNVGKRKCPIVDTWWQTETGGILITPLPGVTPTKPGSATLPFFGIVPEIIDDDGNVLEGNGVEGNLAMQRPWPGMMRTIYGDKKRFFDTYFARFPGKYFSGDGCKRDEDGYYWITGRVDDVIIVSGHNLGTAEIEGAIGGHPAVAEAAVVGYPHDIKGNAIYAFVTLRTGQKVTDSTRDEIIKKVRSDIGPHASPGKIQFTDGLPKTRSGKIMRRILRNIACNEIDDLGDTSTLADPSVVDSLVEERI